jgi:Ca-activated chloride channel homolog
MKEGRSMLTPKTLCSNLVLLFLLLHHSFAAAQDEPTKVEKSEAQGEVLRVDTDLVSVEVAVTSRAGTRNAAGLKAEDFVIYEDGVRQKVSNFSATDVPFNLVLLIDTSGSAREEVDLMRKAALRFLDELRPQDRVALIEFNDKISLLQDLTDDRRSVEKALSRLKPGRGTAFYDTLELTLEEVLKSVAGRKAVVALTDGVDSYGAGTYNELLPLVERAQASFYFLEVDTEARTEAGMMRDCNDERRFQFSEKQLKKYLQEYASGADAAQYADHCDLSRLERMQINRRLYESARRELRELAEKTGGRVYPVRQLHQLEPAYAQIAAELRTQYSLGYYPTNERRDGKWRTLRVEVKRAGLEAKAKPGYRAPKG